MNLYLNKFITSERIELYKDYDLEKVGITKNYKEIIKNEIDQILNYYDYDVKIQFAINELPHFYFALICYSNDSNLICLIISDGTYYFDKCTEFIVSERFRYILNILFSQYLNRWNGYNFDICI